MTCVASEVACKLGNSLVVRLPASVIEALTLKEGDKMEVPGERVSRVARDRLREDALARLKALRWTLPGFRFSREEANERGTDERDR